MCYQVLKQPHTSSDSQPRQSTLHLSPSSPTATCSLLPHFSTPKTEQELSLSLHCWPQAPKQIYWFLHQSLRDKGPKLAKRASSLIPNSKKHLVHVLAGGCVCYSLSLAPSRLERRPVNLPCLWQPPEVCNHLLQRVKSPLIWRVHSLDLRTK